MNYVHVITMTRPMGSTLFRDPQALSSTLTALGMLQPRTFGSLNHVDPSDSVSNYYIKPLPVSHVFGARSGSPRIILMNL